MGGGSRTGRVYAARTCAVLLAALATIALRPPAARAFDFFDGKLQVHGAFEEQIRGLGSNLNVSNNIDLAQWYNVLNIQADINIAPDGWGPFNVLHSYVRVEGRFDCVWTHACGIFSSANAFGDDVEHLPGYKTTGRQNGWNGSVFIGSLDAGPLFPVQTTAKYLGRKLTPVVDPRTIGLANCPTTGCNEGVPLVVNDREPAHIAQLPGFVGLFPSKGTDQNFTANGDPVPGADPAYFFFSRQSRCKFGVRQTDGPENGASYQIIGPIDPHCQIQPIAALRFKPNPFNPGDFDPIIPGVGSAQLPGRPSSQATISQRANPGWSQGVFYPSPALRKLIEKNRIMHCDQSDTNCQMDQNFNQDQLEWNHGGSQQETYELKEAYLDMEFFDSRLWVRAGKQNIVWGKTELFRTTDQFNPQDLALASLPSLEESRIALNSVRAVWSFYDVGPADDVRLEVAFNFDKMNPADIGRCGEPFTALVACNKTTGLWVHGLTGFALAGEQRPPDPWTSIKGLESGARLEFRLGRFSFQVSDFWGYDDFPYVKQIATYERDVDPFTGLPRKSGATGPCTSRVNPEPDCLTITSNITANGRNTSLSQANQQNVRDNTALNQQLFAMICATSIGFNSLDPTACGQSIFNSSNNPLSGLPIPRNGPPGTGAKGRLTLSSVLANALAGNPGSAQVVQALAGGVPPPFVVPNVDPCDGFQFDGCPSKGQAPKADYGGSGGSFAAGPSLNQVLTDEQEALLGCGHFYGTDCEVDGIDLLNAEASAILQSFAGFEGTYGNPYAYTTLSGVQPGTRGWQGPLPGTRYIGHKQIVQIPGTRGPVLNNGLPNSAYNPLVDGCVDPAYGGAACAGANLLTIPGNFGAAAGQVFKSEMAVISFNLQVLVAALSSAPANPPPLPNTPPEKLNFDYAHPYSTAPGQCSWAQPQFCSSQQALLTVSGTQRAIRKAGGTYGYGRRDFVWASGADAILKYNKRNVFGFSMDFAEDVTKSNWGVETAWISSNKFTDNNQFSGISNSDTFNVTVSVDRPTFINFLNQNRTFFFNSQWFFQYISNYHGGFTDNGPFNVLGTFTIQTGYFQDRLLPNVTFVYDVRSNSGAALPEITYRFTENFSGAVGLNFFWGRWQMKDAPVQSLASVGNRVGRDANSEAVENALAVVRERDELFLRLRYTF